MSPKQRQLVDVFHPVHAGIRPTPDIFSHFELAGQVPVTVASLILSQVCDGAMLAARELAAQRAKNNAK